MKKLVDKINAWWKSLPVKTRQGVEIAGCCLGMVTVFFTLIYLFGVA
jgi:hypothetical protein